MIMKWGIRASRYNSLSFGRITYYFIGFPPPRLHFPAVEVIVELVMLFLEAEVIIYN